MRCAGFDADTAAQHTKDLGIRYAACLPYENVASTQWVLLAAQPSLQIGYQNSQWLLALLACSDTLHGKLLELLELVVTQLAVSAKGFVCVAWAAPYPNMKTANDEARC